MISRVQMKAYGEVRELLTMTAVHHYSLYFDGGCVIAVLIARYACHSRLSQCWCVRVSTLIALAVLLHWRQ